MFEKTRIKLTAWYLLIIMSVSLLFSLIIFSLINVEFVRFERSQVKLQKSIEQGFEPKGPRQERFEFESVEEARARLILSLGIMNLGILIFAGGAGYFLAGKTLRPIKEMLEDQNRFISDSSHEIRTPLTSLRSEIEVCLMNKKLTLPQAKNTLKSNLEEVIQLQLLSDRLLELSIREERINEYTFEEYEITEIIENAIKKKNKLALNKNITIKNNLKKQKIEADSDKLTELFGILLENAIKYSPKNSNIKIDSKISRNNMKIYVKDSGIGIKKEELPHIFDRFYRSDSSRNEDGFGLGLSIAKKIIEEHEGDIKAESSKNNGSTFIITLPI